MLPLTVLRSQYRTYQRFPMRTMSPCWLRLRITFPFLSRSRAATALSAISRHFAGDSFLALDFPPWLAILANSESESFLAMVFPPGLLSGSVLKQSVIHGIILWSALVFMTDFVDVFQVPAEGGKDGIYQGCLGVLFSYGDGPLSTLLDALADNVSGVDEI